MKARSLEEIQSMLASESFRTWWGDLDAFRSERREIEIRLDDLSKRLFHLENEADRDQRTAIDIVQNSSVGEHDVATLHAEADEIENRAIEKVGGYEEQRFRTSDAWVKLGAVEKRLDEARERLEQAKAGVGDLERLKAEVERLVRDHRGAHEAYERQSERKQRLWADVEKLWADALGKGLLATEHEARNSRDKRKAEHLLRSSDQTSTEAEGLREEAASLNERLGELGDRLRHCNMEACEIFGAIAGEDFLYWPCKNSEKHVWCLSLIGDAETYNVEVSPRTLYRAQSKVGVLQLEPLGGGEAEGEATDDRIEAWFRRKASGASPGEAELGEAEETAPVGDADAGKATGG